MLKALSLGAKACSGGRMYLYALAAAGEEGFSSMGNARGIDSWYEVDGV